MTKKIVRLAMIRSNDTDPCPFGLSIPFGCSNAGDIIDKMAPIEIAEGDEAGEEKVKKANKKLFAWRLMSSAEEPARCKYADNIMEGKSSSNCNYDDAAPGVGSTSFLGSPFYSRVMSGVALDGLYSFPVGYYADYNISRNLFYGTYSIQGAREDDIVKIGGIDTADGACVLFHCPDDGAVLLLKRSSEVNDPGTWGLPGGHLEEGEFPAAGATREVSEEMGFIPDPKDIIASGFIEKKDKHKCAIFICAIKSEARDKWEDLIKLNSEHDDYKWFSPEEIPEDLHPVAKFVLRKSANIAE